MRLDSRKVMICIKTRHFSWQRILLLAIGLWSCQRSRLVQLQLILFSSILSSSIVIQLTLFITEECTIDLVINVFSVVLFFVMSAIVYNSFWYNFSEIIERPLKELQDICNELKDKEEIDIMKKYGNNVKYFTFLITMWHMCNIIIGSSILLLPITSRIFGFTLYTDQSKTREMLYKHVPKSLVDRENYLYLILLGTDTSLCIGATAFVASGLMVISYLKHACGMLKIASYRIEKAMNMQNYICPKNETIIYKGIIYAIDIQRTAINFCTFLFTCIQFTAFSLISVAVICLSLNLYAMSKNMLHGNIDQFLIHIAIVIAIFVFLFFFNYIGQEFTDHNNNIFFTAYSIQWYVAPLRIQKLILFLLQRNSKTLSLNFGGVFMLSLEFFASLTKISVSYFTVIYSIQN